jgi:hypothetical protein
VAHPDLAAVPDPSEESAAVEDFEAGKPIFPMGRGYHLASKEMGHELDAVANPQDGDSELKDCGRGLGRAFFIDAPRPAGEDDGLRAFFPDPREGGVKRKNLGIDAELADLTGDELGVLGPEIEDEDFIHSPILANRNEGYNMEPEENSVSAGASLNLRGKYNTMLFLEPS